MFYTHCINKILERFNMQISRHQYSPQFKGSFLINYNNTLPHTREFLENTIGEHKRQIFDDFNGKSNQVMYVMKDSKDFDVANFVLKNKLKFKYYPTVSTKLRFEPDQPQMVIDYIKQNKPTLINKYDELKTFITQNRKKCRAVKNSHISTVDLILNTLKFDKTEGSKNKLPNGITIFKSNNNNTIVVSPKNDKNTRFIYINPHNEYDPIKRYAFDENGILLKEFSSPNGITTFNQEFKKTIKN